MPDSSPPSHPSPPAGSDLLERIVRDRKTRVAEAQARVPEEMLREQARRRHARSPVRDFAAALQRAVRPLQPAIIAEMKRASPSAGRLRTDFDPAALARAYERAGAAALSVLTEPEHFLGRLDDLSHARDAASLPVLCKDFIFCSYQIWEAAAAGADAILLIVALLDDAGLRHLLATAEQAGVAALCEVHDAPELARAVRDGAAAIGVNNRDLRTLVIDENRALDLAPLLPSAALRVAESGMRDGAALARVTRAGYHAALVGEALMRAPDPGAALAAMREAAACAG